MNSILFPENGEGDGRSHEQREHCEKTANGWTRVVTRLALAIFATLAVGWLILTAVSSWMATSAREAIEDAMVLPPELRWILWTFLFLAASSIVFGMVSWRRSRRREARNTLTLGLVGLALVSFVANRNRLVGRYYCLADDIYVGEQRALARETCAEPKRVTFKTAPWIRLLQLRRQRGQIFQADPYNSDWFAALSEDAMPLLWYSSDDSGKLRFFSHPGTDSKTGEQLKPVTGEIHRKWTSEQPEDGQSSSSTRTNTSRRP